MLSLECLRGMPSGKVLFEGRLTWGHLIVPVEIFIYTFYFRQFLFLQKLTFSFHHGRNSSQIWENQGKGGGSHDSYADCFSVSFFILPFTVPDKTPFYFFPRTKLQASSEMGSFCLSQLICRCYSNPMYWEEHGRFELQVLLLTNLVL